MCLEIDGCVLGDRLLYCERFFEREAEMRVILGSSSKWRRQVMDEMGLKFDVMNPDIDERAIEHPDPYMLPKLIARAKAAALLPRIAGEAILITADQVVGWGSEIRGKPRDSEEAVKFLKSYAVKDPRTYSAVFVTNTATKKSAIGVEAVSIHFDPLPDEVIAQLSIDADILNSAGAFTEHRLLLPFKHIIHGTKDSVMGLPKELTRFLIEQVS